MPHHSPPANQVQQEAHPLSAALAGMLGADTPISTAHGQCASAHRPPSAPHALVCNPAALTLVNPSPSLWQLAMDTLHTCTQRAGIHAVEIHQHSWHSLLQGKSSAIQSGLWLLCFDAAQPQDEQAPADMSRAALASQPHPQPHLPALSPPITARQLSASLRASPAARALWCAPGIVPVPLLINGYPRNLLPPALLARAPVILGQGASAADLHTLMAVYLFGSGQAGPATAPAPTTPSPPRRHPVRQTSHSLGELPASVL